MLIHMNIQIYVYIHVFIRVYICCDSLCRWLLWSPIKAVFRAYEQIDWLHDVAFLRVRLDVHFDPPLLWKHTNTHTSTLTHYIVGHLSFCVYVSTSISILWCLTRRSFLLSRLLFYSLFMGEPPTYLPCGHNDSSRLLKKSGRLFPPYRKSW